MLICPNIFSNIKTVMNKHIYLLNDEEDEVIYKVNCSLKEYKVASNKALTEDYGVDLRGEFCGELAFKVVKKSDIDVYDKIVEVSLEEYVALWKDVMQAFANSRLND
jgi:hypothetical protein